MKRKINLKQIDLLINISQNIYNECSGLRSAIKNGVDFEIEIDDTSLVNECISLCNLLLKTN